MAWGSKSSVAAAPLPAPSFAAQAESLVVAGARTVVDSVRAGVSAVEERVSTPWSLSDIVLIAVFWIGVRYGLRKAHDVLHPSEPFEGSYTESLRRPLLIFSFVLLVLWSLDIAVLVLSALDITALDHLRLDHFDQSAYTLFTTYALDFYLTRHLVSWLPKAVRDEPGISNLVLRFTKIVLYTTGAVLALQARGISMQGLVAAGGLGGLAFGLAAKDVMSNVFGGTMLTITRPFAPGEKIFIVGGKDDGVAYRVKYIGVYQTALETKDTRPVYIPNASFLTSKVINITRCTHRFFTCELSIAFSDGPRLEAALGALREYIYTHPKTDNAFKHARVHLRGYGQGGFVVRIEAHLSVRKKEAFLELQHELLIGVYKVLGEAGVGISSPLFQVESNSMSGAPVLSNGETAPLGAVALS